MSIGKLQASLASATQETTLALANLNFDFSLVKVEAPREYQGVGNSLSTIRKSAAENGSPHVVARRLSSLFAGILPATPNLLQAYGVRVSETCAAASKNVKSPNVYGIFKDYVGLDGTSIWAAATSGEGALSVHLLACMIARVFSSSEATSIWEELVIERKKELTDNAAEFVPLGNLVASQLSITKEQLSEWDASARSWLRVADEVLTNAKRQKQVMLILGNLNKPISPHTSMYKSVCNAWITALSTIDHIIGGSPYSISDGSVLVALASWHIYPDIVVLGAQNQEVKQRDELIRPGGVVTVGWEEAAVEESPTGVTWSLSLSHLRYYGLPVATHKALSPASGRLLVDEFLHVVLGAVIASWRVPPNQLKQSVSLLDRLTRVALSAVNNREDSAIRRRMESGSWIAVLHRVCSRLIKEYPNEDGPKWKLVRLGLRRQQFLTDRDTRVFLLRTNDLSKLMPSYLHKIEHMRSLARTLDIDAKELVIRIDASDWVIGLNPRHSCTAFVTVSPIGGESGSHRVWYDDGLWEKSRPNITFNRSFASDILAPAVSLGGQTSAFDRLRPELVVTKDVQSRHIFEWPNPPVCLSTDSSNDDAKAGGNIRSERSILKGFLGKKQVSQKPVAAASGRPMVGHWVAGDVNSVALFRIRDTEDTSKTLGITKDAERAAAVPQLTELLDRNHLSPDAILAHFSSLHQYEETSLLIASLRCVASILTIYDELPGASISPALITSQKALGYSKWARQPEPVRRVADTAAWGEGHSTLLPFRIDRADAFACIAMLESGTFDLEPESLNGVIAISVDDSLYIAAPLLSDPATKLSGHEIRRVMGNIGRAGMAFLIPPARPRTRKANPDQWQAVDHAPFDGALGDHFSNTSLHMSFTGYTQPIVVTEHGGRFTEAFFIESVMSVHDAGRWVADLDILDALRSNQLHAIVQQEHCRQKAAGHPPPDHLFVTSIDRWEELLDLPGNAVVVRAHGNWQARLAASAVSVQLGHQTILFQGHGCWECGAKIVRQITGGGANHYESQNDDDDDGDVVVFIL